MVDVCTYMGSPIAATKVEFTKVVDGIDAAIIELADITAATYSMWVGRIKKPGIAICYPTTGSYDWYGQVETIDKTNKGLSLFCKGIVANGFYKNANTYGPLLEGIVIARSGSTVTLDQALSTDTYVGCAVTFDDLTPPEDISEWITASTCSYSFSRYINDAVTSITVLTTATYSDLIIGGTVANTTASDGVYLTVSFTSSAITGLYGEGTLWSADTFAKYWQMAIDFEFSLASLVYPSSLYKTKIVSYVSSPPPPPYPPQYNHKPHLSAFNYTSSAWEGIGGATYGWTVATYEWPSMVQIIPLQYKKNLVDRTNQRCRIRYHMPTFLYNPNFPRNLHNTRIDYLAIKCVYNDVNRIVQMDPTEILSHTASVLSLGITVSDVPYNVISGDGYSILDTYEHVLSDLMADILITGGGDNALTGACAYSINVTGWTGRKDRFTPPTQIMADMCKEGGYHFWMDIDTDGLPLLKITASWNTTASRSLAITDINSLYSPELKIYDTKYNGVKVVGARHRYGDQYIDAEGSAGDVSDGTNFKLYRAPHINTNNECDKIAQNLYTRYSKDAEVLTCTLTDSTLAHQLQPGESLDIAVGIIGKTFSQIPCISKHVLITPTDGVTVIKCQFGEVPY